MRNCASCQARLRAQKGAMGQLALLRADMHEEPGAQCPPADLWLQVAAGMPLRDAEFLLNHSTTCDYCGPLLRQAVDDLTYDLTPQEEAQIAGLSSSTDEWQKKLAAQLHDAQAHSGVRFPDRRGRPFWGANLLAPARLALAAALMGLIVLGVRDYRQAIFSSSQVSEKSADIQRLHVEVLQQNSQIGDLNTKLDQLSAPGKAAAPQRSANAEVPTLTLNPGLTRGRGEMKRLADPRGAEMVKIGLHVADFPEGVLREELQTVDQRQIWAQELRPSDAEKKVGTLVLVIPPYLLTPDDYQIILSRKLPTGTEEVASYVFRVTR